MVFLLGERYADWGNFVYNLLHDFNFSKEMMINEEIRDMKCTNYLLFNVKHFSHLLPISWIPNKKFRGSVPPVLNFHQVSNLNSIPFIIHE